MNPKASGSDSYNQADSVWADQSGTANPSIASNACLPALRRPSFSTSGSNDEDVLPAHHSANTTQPFSSFLCCPESHSCIVRGCRGAYHSLLVAAVAVAVAVCQPPEFPRLAACSSPALLHGSARSPSLLTGVILPARAASFDRLQPWRISLRAEN